MKPVIVLTTLPADFNARALATDLVERRLAACVNLVERIHSIYRWEGKVSADDEQLLVMKTTDERAGELKEALFAAHPYDVPEFVILPIERIEGPYLQWLLDAVS